MAEDRKIDWEAIEREYRVGTKSLREIGREYGVSDTAIRKRAKQFGWERDLTEKVNQQVRNALVRIAVRESNERTDEQKAKARASERDTVEAAARERVDVIRTERNDINVLRELEQDFFKELRRENEMIPDLLQLVEEETAGDANNQRRNAMIKALSLPSRAQTLRDLAQVMHKRIALERQAFNLEDQPVQPPEDPEQVKRRAEVKAKLYALLSDQAPVANVINPDGSAV